MDFLDNCLINKGFQIAFKCSCCERPRYESIQHVFCYSKYAHRIWNFFDSWMGSKSGGTLLQQKLNAWWIAKVNSPCHKAVLSLIPNCICWEF